MSGTSFMEKYGLPSSRSPAPAATTTNASVDDSWSEPVEESGCIGVLRGVRDRAVMLELRSKTGSVRAIPYAWIERIDFDPSEGLSIRAGGSTIRIKGRNLDGGSGSGVGVLTSLCRQRVVWMRESPRTTALSASADEPVVESMEWD